MQLRHISLLALALSTFLAGNTFADQATYQITFTGQWPGTLPNNAHFSPLIGATHCDPGAILSVGDVASPGVENVAEIGVTTTLVNEINAGISAGTLGTLVSRDGNIGPSQTVTLNMTVDSEHSLLTLITMIAPSPDWFVGVHDLDLLDSNGEWHQQLVIAVGSYDAGTENGNNFSINNAATVPQSVITDLDAANPNGILDGAGSIAQYIITRTDATPTTFNTFRGTLVGGDVSSIQSSDDDYLSYNPEFTVNATEAPVSIEFESQFGVETTTALNLEIEAGANTPGLTQTLEFFNFDTGAYEEIRSDASGFTDAVIVATASGSPNRYIENSTGNVRTRIGWRQTGFTILYPWTSRVDQIRWNITP